MRKCTSKMIRPSGSFTPTMCRCSIGSRRTTSPSSAPPCSRRSTTSSAIEPARRSCSTSTSGSRFTRRSTSASIGYYVLPILHGDRLIGRIDPKMDREHGRLHIHAVHAEKDAPLNRKTARSIRDAIEDLATFLGATDDSLHPSRAVGLAARPTDRAVPLYAFAHSRYSFTCCPSTAQMREAKP